MFRDINTLVGDKGIIILEWLIKNYENTLDLVETDLKSVWSLNV
jgi:hypothetical protein